MVKFNANDTFCHSDSISIVWNFNVILQFVVLHVTLMLYFGILAVMVYFGILSVMLQFVILTLMLYLGILTRMLLMCLHLTLLSL